VELDPETEVLPLIGSKEGIFHITQALIDPGDVVFVPDPGYITYTRSAQFAGGEIFYLPLRAERDYLIDFSEIPDSLARRAKIIWMNYPNNPTAATAPPEFFAEAVDFAARYGILICHDAAYTQVTYNGYRAPSILETPGARNTTIEFNTLSKSHNMAGWRVAATVGSAEVLKTLFRLKSNIDSGHFLPVLEAAIEAMTGDQSWLTGRNEEYCRRRDIALDALTKIGMAASCPMASLYVWCRIPAGWDDSTAFADALLDATGVSLTPGPVFGSNGDGFLRISLTRPTGQVAQAMQRMQEWLAQ
jgi:LL-diaminopimelate aminotransferase